MVSDIGKKMYPLIQNVIMEIIKWILSQDMGYINGLTANTIKDISFLIKEMVSDNYR